MRVIIPGTTILCAFCGKSIPADSSFCNYCGKHVAGASGQVGVPEDCALCEGRGKWPGVFTDTLCTACGGKGSVLVVPPPKKCALCDGTGKKVGLWSSSVCTACNGTGWAHVLK